MHNDFRVKRQSILFIVLLPRISRLIHEITLNLKMFRESYVNDPPKCNIDKNEKTSSISIFYNDVYHFGKLKNS